jgi:hypothetical protein
MQGAAPWSAAMGAVAIGQNETANNPSYLASVCRLAGRDDRLTSDRRASLW